MLFLPVHTLNKINHFLLGVLSGTCLLTMSCSTPSHTETALPVQISYPMPDKAIAVTNPSPSNGVNPVYRNPTIAVVTLRSHIDEQGRLLGPQVMYQITDPGGWNIDSIEQDGTKMPLVGDVLSLAALKQSPNNPSTKLEPLLDISQRSKVIITGLMDPRERSKAEAFRRETKSDSDLIYDPSAGWLLLPIL
jgi:hypothetical protein